MHSTVLFILALALTVDSFAVSVALGLPGRTRHSGLFWKIPLTFAVVQGLMPLLGWWAGFGVKSLIEGVDHWVAFGLLGVIGVKMIHDAIVAARAEEIVDDPPSHREPLDAPPNRLPARPDTATSSDGKRLSRRRLFSLAVATSIDAFAVGLTMPLLDVSLFAFPLTLGVATFAVSTVGLVAGRRVGGLFERRIEIIGGIVLIGIGTKILLQHLGS